MSSNLIGHIANTMGFLIANKETITANQFKGLILEVYDVTNLKTKAISDFLDQLDGFTFKREFEKVRVYKNGQIFIT